MDDLRSQIKTRGLSSGGSQHPLIEFKGTFKGFEPEQDTRYNRLMVKLQFEDIEVIASRTPYEFPVTEIKLPHSERDSGLWGIFSKSAIPYYPDATSELDSLFSHRMHMKFTEGHMMWDQRANNGAGGESARGAWEVVAVEGVVANSNGSTPSTNGSTLTPSAASPMKQVVTLMQGKTQQEWAQAALRDPIVKGDSGLVSRILNQSLIGELQAGGIVSKEGDRFKVDEGLLAAL